MKVDQKICGTIWDRRGGIVKCGKAVATEFNKNSPGGQCKQNSTVQGTSKEAEKRGRKTSRSRWS